jgi:hypothetical protein
MSDQSGLTSYVVEWEGTVTCTIWLDTNPDHQYVFEWRTNGSKHMYRFSDTNNGEALSIPETLADALGVIATHIEMALES